jgi:hypothetical protein
MANHSTSFKLIGIVREISAVLQSRCSVMDTKIGSLPVGSPPK